MKAKILIAEDEPEIVAILRDRLKVNGFETIEANEEVRTIELAHKKKPDLILLDLKMPAGRGKSVLKSLSSHPETKQIPVIVLTAMPARDVKEEVLAEGAEDFIQKPYEATVLIDKILKLLAQPMIRQPSN